MYIALVAGTRPNFIKLSPLYRELKGKFPVRIIHTGQHYDNNLSRIFFEELDIPEPHFYLGVGSGPHGEQTGKIMIALEKLFLKEKPSLVVVFGDVNSTLASALVAVKLHIPLAHVEAGLRSYDRTMPEEVNRVVTDALSDFLFTPSRDADENLKKEGIPEEKIFFVGNIMIDTLVKYLPLAKKRKIHERLKLEKHSYILLTLHRPSNVDRKEKLGELLEVIEYIMEYRKVVFPIHPRTWKNLKKFNLFSSFPWLFGNERFIPLEPVGYLDFLALEMYADAVLTDSGGVQEETTYLGVPCFTIRKNKERPVTVKMGTNTLCGDEKEKIIRHLERFFKGYRKKGKIPPLWDGKTSKRIVEILTRQEVLKHD